MKRHKSSISCPVCYGPLQPKVLECSECNIQVEGAFSQNEFSSLDEDTLHFLRVFITCDGRIRDIEKALGISYPTVKSQLSQLKKALGLADYSQHSEDNADNSDRPAEAEEQPESGPSIADVLEQLGSGDLPYNEALTKIKRAKLV